jgi:hypothetical protein
VVAIQLWNPKDLIKHLLVNFQYGRPTKPNPKLKAFEL